MIAWAGGRYHRPDHGVGQSLITGKYELVPDLHRLEQKLMHWIARGQGDEKPHDPGGLRRGAQAMDVTAVLAGARNYREGDIMGYSMGAAGKPLMHDARAACGGTVLGGGREYSNLPKSRGYTRAVLWAKDPAKISDPVEKSFRVPA